MGRGISVLVWRNTITPAQTKTKAAKCQYSPAPQAYDGVRPAVAAITIPLERIIVTGVLVFLFTFPKAAGNRPSRETAKISLIIHNTAPTSPW